MQNLANVFLSLVAAGPELAAAVTNAGGLGVIGGVGYVCPAPDYTIHLYSDFPCRVDPKNAQVHHCRAQGRLEG